ncbi:hypothetical protein [Burkholderia territorii]|uniref:hypothetical protein n=1 Tax=Burkholderia territorii TaxID=1503055 RepID=UPI000A501970|nr:hypothetical protein [Burkholderia territorii]
MKCIGNFFLRSAALFLFGLNSLAWGQITQTAGPCDSNATTCSQSTQSVGNPTTTSTATNSTSTSSQADTSAAQNGNTISPTVTVTPQDNMSNGANTNEGNTTTANGGAGGSSTASGNSSSNSNTSSVGNTTTGPSTASANNNTNSGGNVNSSGSGNVTGGSNNGNTSGGSATTTSGAVSGGSGGSVGAVSPAQSVSSNLGQTASARGGKQSSLNSNQYGQNIGTGNTTVNANTYSTYKAIYIPPVVPPTPASNLAVGNIVKETLACGPLAKKTSRTVEGTYFGLLSDSKFEQGHDDSVEPILDGDGRQMYHDVPLVNDLRGQGFHRYGSQIVMFTAIVGIAGARNIAIGAGSSAGGWGQSGMGTSGSIQQMVTTIQVIPCDLGIYITKAAIDDISSITKIHQ